MSKDNEIYPTIQPLQKMWKVSELAKYLQVAPNTIYRWIYADRIKTMHLGTLVRIPNSEVERITNIIKSTMK